MKPKLFTIRNRKFIRFEVLSLDVWGNARDGWELNAAYHTGEFIFLPEDYGERDIILALKRAGHMKRGIHHSTCEIDFIDRDMIEIYDARNRRPEFQLQVAYDDMVVEGSQT